jgi:hypothetical protein
MRDDLEITALMALVRAAAGSENKAALDADLDDLFAEARENAGGTDREARHAVRLARSVLVVLDRHAGLVAALARGRANRLLAGECGRWQELLDATRARLADGAPVLIYESRRRSRRACVA